MRIAKLSRIRLIGTSATCIRFSFPLSLHELLYNEYITNMTLKCSPSITKFLLPSSPLKELSYIRICIIWSIWLQGIKGSILTKWDTKQKIYPNKNVIYLEESIIIARFAYFNRQVRMILIFYDGSIYEVKYWLIYKYALIQVIWRMS